MQVTVIPMKNWQQNRNLLEEDSNFSESSAIDWPIRLFWWLYTKAEILIQAITSLGKTDRKPEEIAHKVCSISVTIVKI
jgi:hypothetical protein